MSGVESSGRERILSRIRAALADRDVVEHPGAFLGWRPIGDVRVGGIPASEDRADRFATLFHAAGGETVRVDDGEAAASWLVAFSADFPTLAFGRGVPGPIRPPAMEAEPRDARLGVSMARGAVAETGSLIMDARDGRRSQLLVPTHVVIVGAETIHETLVDALTSVKTDLPSAIGLHSGPSKSADIGQIMVRGVHGPGRVIALIVDDAIGG